MQFDDVLIQLGQFGKYQRIQYTLLCLPGILCAFHQLASVFLAATPEFRCALPSGVYNETDTFALQGEEHRQLVMEYINSTVANNSLMMEYPDSCHILNATSECERFVYSKEVFRSSITTDLDLVCAKGSIQKTTSTSVYMSGVLVGAFVLGILSDAIGRKKTLIICVILQGVSGLACAFTTSYYPFIFLRFSTGMFSMGLFMTNYVLGMELVGPKYRMVAGIVMQYFFALGYVALTAIAYGTREWKYTQIAISAPSFIFILYIWFVPESARWLISKNRIDEAEVIVQNAAKVNKVSLPKNVFASLAESSKTESLLVMFDSPKFPIRSLIIFFNWCVIAMGYYGLSLNSGSLGGNIYINFMLGGLVEFPAYTVCFACNKIGRKPFHLAGMMIGGLACLGTVFADLYARDSLEKSQLTTVFVSLNMVGKFGMTIAFCIIYLWSAELYPTSIRNTMMGISSTLARVGAIAAPYIIDSSEYLPDKLARVVPAAIFGSLVIVGGLLSIMLPETSGTSLPETIDEANRFPHHNRDKYGQQTGVSTADLVSSEETKFD